MKQIIFHLFVLTFVFSSCQRPEKKEQTPKIQKIKVLSTIAMISDLVASVGDEYVEAVTLIKGEIDPHTYELVKGDDEKFATAIVIFYNGLSLEHGYSLRHNLENNPKAVSLGSYLQETMGDKILNVDGQCDPHVWMDVSLWKAIVDPIVDTLVKHDPAHADTYIKNGLALKETMEKKDQEILSALQKIPSEKRFLVTSHNAFNYFVRRYLADVNELSEDSWKKRLSAPEGLAPEAELSSHDIQRVLDYVSKHKIEVLFSESNVNKDSLKKIVNVARKKGLNLKISDQDLYADSMGKQGSYLDMISHNTKILLKEFENK